MILNRAPGLIRPGQGEPTIAVEVGHSRGLLADPYVDSLMIDRWRHWAAVGPIVFHDEGSANGIDVGPALIIHSRFENDRGSRRPPAPIDKQQ